MLFPRRARDSRKRIREESPREESSAGIWGAWYTNKDHKTQQKKKTNDNYNIVGFHFPVVMYGWESWTIKKAECRRINAFEL